MCYNNQPLQTPKLAGYLPLIDSRLEIFTLSHHHVLLSRLSVHVVAFGHFHTSLSASVARYAAGETANIFRPSEKETKNVYPLQALAKPLSCPRPSGYSTNITRTLCTYRRLAGRLVRAHHRKSKYGETPARRPAPAQRKTKK